MGMLIPRSARIKKFQKEDLASIFLYGKQKENLFEILLSKAKQLGSGQIDIDFIQYEEGIPHIEYIKEHELSRIIILSKNYQFPITRDYIYKDEEDKFLNLFSGYDDFSLLNSFEISVVNVNNSNFKFKIIGIENGKGGINEEILKDQIQAPEETLSQEQAANESK